MLSDLAFQTVNVDDLDQPQSLAVVDIVTEQQLLDWGLYYCMDSAWYTGMDVMWFDNVWMPWDFPLCLPQAWLATLATGVGLLGMRTGIRRAGRKKTGA